ncbi:DUF222 domain-containing protein [Streptomyces sp. bgisy100]|uniref:HNH endonuclease signature motif containing protein n=1 Tax=Streptomyces sp. bgisy100 TaxID=3413783 RepID=UPI003D728A6A
MSPDERAACLATCAPGPETAPLLGDLDPAQLSAAGRIDALRALERHAEWVQALQVRLLGALDADRVDPAPEGDSPAEKVWDFTCEQVACALRISNRTAATRLATARHLTRTFRATLDLLQAGRIHYMQAHAVVDVTRNLPRATAARVETLVVRKMPEQAVSATRKALHRAVLKADPEGADGRHRSARAERRVSHRMDQDGMAWWSVYLPAEQAAQLDAAVDAHARCLQGAEEHRRAKGARGPESRPGVDAGRTLEQRRVDALVDLVLHGDVPFSGMELLEDGATLRPISAGGRSAPTIQVTVSLDTLIGVSEEPAELEGYGAVTAVQARALASDPGSVWRRLITDPGTGILLKVDPTTYRPTADVTRHVTIRDRRCAFPSCRMPAHRCDLDHVVPFDHRDFASGGPTTPDNLVALCRRHHMLKHHAGWSVTRDPATGRTTWTAPTGHVYLNEPGDFTAVA